MSRQIITRAVLLTAALSVVVGCSGDRVTGATGGTLATVALIELEGARPALYVQKSDGTARTRIHFTGAVDDVAGNSPLVPRLTDANILALRSVKWSPDGTRLALVATVAADQSEVVVMDADGRNARIVSVNYAYVLGDVDWSPDGNRLTYIMATRPFLQGLEVFVSDVVGTPRVTQVTNGSGYRGLGGTIRFAAGGSAVWISQVTGEGGAPLFEQVGAVRRVDLATGAISSVLENIAGEVQAVAHSGAYAIVLRRKALVNGVYDSRLVQVPLLSTGGGGERMLVDGGRLDYARLTSNDSRMLVLRDGAAFTAMAMAGGAEVSVRGSGAEPLGADVRN
jgi:dipeptidyl aminopeptidase/acylaminoacyl peptidase